MSYYSDKNMSYSEYALAYREAFKDWLLSSTGLPTTWTAFNHYISDPSVRYPIDKLCALVDTYPEEWTEEVDEEISDDLLANGNDINKL